MTTMASKEKDQGEREVEEKIYVAVGNKVKESKSTLIWAIQNSGGKRVCILHVLQPAQMIPTPIGYFPADRLGKEEVQAYREKERKEVSKALDEYLRLCSKAGLINQHGIEKLVMGAAADKQYSRSMTELKSKKAIYVRENAPPSCHIWFVCKGYLIHTRAAVKPPCKDGGENRPGNAEGNAGASPTAPPFDVSGWSPPRFSADTDDSPSASRSASPAAAGWLGHRSQFSTDYHSPVRHSLSGTVPESLYLDECMRRKEAEAELAKVKGELEYMKNNMLGELRCALEQKTLLENQMGNSTFLLKIMGEKLASTIQLVHNHGEPHGQNT